MDLCIETAATVAAIVPAQGYGLQGCADGGNMCLEIELFQISFIAGIPEGPDIHEVAGVEAARWGGSRQD